tara:strand:- start:1436 stop:2989 length:1554 start_codon:yes stop_codon:yes gene_type:complete
MAVTATGLRQTNPLIDELLKRAMQQGSSSVNQYTAESFGGNFPIGSLTADVLKGVRKRTALNQAQMAIDDKNKAMADLLAVRGDDRYTVDASGNITEKTMMPREQVAGFDQSKIGQTERMDGTGAVIDSSVAQAMGTPTEDEAQNLAIALKASQARETTGLPASQLEQEVLKEEVTPTTFRYGPEQDPNFIERNVLGKRLKGEEISNVNPLAIKAGISPFDLQKLDRDIEDKEFARETQLITRQTTLKDNILKDQQIVANNLQNILNTAKFENDALEIANTTKKLKFINKLTSDVSKKPFTDFKSAELYRAKQFANAGYGDESLKIIKNLKDTNLISSLSQKEEINFIKDFRKTEAKEFGTIDKSVTIFKKLLDASKADGGVGDYSLMISYIKALDDSVVREGEVRTFNSMQGVIKQIEIEFDRAKGEGFPEYLKNQMVDLAFGTLNSYLTNYNNNKIAKIKNYEDLGLNPVNIFSGYESINFLDGQGNALSNSKGATLPNFVLSVPAKDPEELEFE